MRLVCQGDVLLTKQMLQSKRRYELFVEAVCCKIQVYIYLSWFEPLSARQIVLNVL